MADFIARIISVMSPRGASASGKPGGGAFASSPPGPGSDRDGGGGHRLRHAAVAASLKGEDRFILKPVVKTQTESDGEKSVSFYAVLDGHNGSACVDFSTENILGNIMGCLKAAEREGSVAERISSWREDMPQAMVNAFVKTHEDFMRTGKTSGSTATCAILDGPDLYCAGVGDTKAVFDDGEDVTDLTVFHRVDENVDERDRILAGGGAIKRVEIGGSQHGPLRVDGRLCVSRSFGDPDVSALVSEVPDVSVTRIPASGGRLIIASDGVWDVLSSRQAALFARKYPKDLGRACERVVRKAFTSVSYATMTTRGFRDDTTVVIVDVLPPSCASFADCIRRRKAQVTSNPAAGKITVQMLTNLSSTLDEMDEFFCDEPRAYEDGEVEGEDTTTKERLRGYPVTVMTTKRESRFIQR